jgi:hypothetical protein
MLKPGYKTTEFAVTILTGVVALIASIADYLPPKYAALAASVVTVGYAISRGLTKLSPPPVVTAPTPPPPTP